MRKIVFALALSLPLCWSLAALAEAPDPNDGHGKQAAAVLDRAANKSGDKASASGRSEFQAEMKRGEGSKARDDSKKNDDAKNNDMRKQQRSR